MRTGLIVPDRRRLCAPEADIAVHEAKLADLGGVMAFTPSGRRDCVAPTAMTDLIRRALGAWVTNLPVRPAGLRPLMDERDDSGPAG